MKKSFAKRIKITKTGKLLRRASAQDHFRAKKTTHQLKRKKAMRPLLFSKQTLGKYL